MHPAQFIAESVVYNLKTMNLKYKLLFGIHILILLTTILQSCCEEELIITDEGSMTAWELYKTDGGGIGRKEISTITGDFIIGAYFREETSWIDNISLINRCYATSCKETRLNSIDEESLVISIDKGFVLNGDSIQPEINLLELENSGITILSITGGWIEFRFTETFFSNTTLENDDYKFYFIGKTNDNVKLNSEITLRIEN